MNVVLIVVDSLRAQSLAADDPSRPSVPFIDRLGRETVWFRRAHATECWTLPTHLSMFTGLLPSEHGAHFQTMAYAGARETVAERFAAAGYHTEVVTRNSLFDGTVPGATRGFRQNTQILAPLRRTNALGILLALSKPRVRRLIRTSGFFDVLQRSNRAFLSTLARMIIPADRAVLDYTLDRMSVALVEHFHYPHVARIQPRYAQNVAGAIVGRWKAIVRREGTFVYDLGADGDERTPEAADVGGFAARCQRDGAPRSALTAAIEHLRRWQTSGAASDDRPASAEAAVACAAGSLAG